MQKATPGRIVLFRPATTGENEFPFDRNGAEVLPAIVIQAFEGGQCNLGVFTPKDGVKNVFSVDQYDGVETVDTNVYAWSFPVHVGMMEKAKDAVESIVEKVEDKFSRNTKTEESEIGDAKPKPSVDIAVIPDPSVESLAGSIKEEPKGEGDPNSINRNS